MLENCSICFDLKTVNFNYCYFCWGRWKANNVAHCLTKFASFHLSVVTCNNSSLPPFVLDVN
jgi:hypothetical protein